MNRLLCLVCMLCSIISSAAAQKVHKGYRDGQIWYRLKETAYQGKLASNKKQQRALNEFSFLQSVKSKHRLKTVEAPFAIAKTATPLERTFLLTFDETQDADLLIKELENSGMVEYAEKVPIEELMMMPNDTRYSRQWHLQKINAAAAWDHAKGENTIIAILDLGIQVKHPDIEQNLWTNPGEIPGNGIDDEGNGYIDDVYGWDMASNSPVVESPGATFTHGIAVAGIASAVTNNGIGVASIGYGCKLMIVKASNNSEGITHGYPSMVYAADNGAHIMVCSFAGTYTSYTQETVVKYVLSKGCIIVAGAGNANNTNKHYPAAYPGVISVAATDSTDKKASYSCFGNWITISSPGVAIYTTVLRGDYTYFDGTSAATPLVAGLIGLIRSVNPRMPNSEIIRCLTSTAVNIDAQNPAHAGLMGAGRINAEAAILAAKATLTHKAVPAFTTSHTTISAGGRITFTDSSYYAPDTYTWHFEGGTPSTYEGKNPPLIYYHTPGHYDVSLTVTNNNGSVTELKSKHILVASSGNCNPINEPVPANWDSINYFLGSEDGESGWINGMNLLRDRQKAMYFDINTTPAHYIGAVHVRFGLGYSADPAKQVPVHIYDGSGGTPGALLGTTHTTMGQIMQDVDNKQSTLVHFQQAVPVPASNQFFVSVDLSNLCWDDNCKDTLSILSSGVPPGAIWEQKRNLNWYPYLSYDSWYLEASLYIHPYLSNEPLAAPSITLQSDAMTVTPGIPVTFTATAANGGNVPRYNFKVNDLIVQSGNNNIWTSTTLRSGDAVTCQLITDLACVTTPLVISNKIILAASGGLPVKLTVFSGRAERTGNLLNWTTATEINSAYFAIEKSSFNAGPFIEIGRVTAAGESNQLLHYRYTDLQVSPGTTAYYRLKMVDLDGHTAYSSILTLSTSPSNDISLVVWPQPVAQGIPAEVKISGKLQGNVRLQLVNAMGQVVQIQTVTGSAGVYKTRINTHSLASGLYSIRCYNKGNLIVNSKLVVTN